MVRGKVAGHYESAVLRDVEFRVRPGGRARVLRDGRKNVHAFAIAEKWARPVDGLMHPYPGRLGLDEVSYNPYGAGYFFRLSSGEPIHSADIAYLTEEHRVFVPREGA